MGSTQKPRQGPPPEEGIIVVEVLTKRCAVSECSSKFYAKGFCQKHYNGARGIGKSQIVQEARLIATLGSTCSIPNCVEGVVGHGYCTRHYDAFRLKGSPTATVKKLTPRGSLCKFKRCSRNLAQGGRGLCSPHYTVFRRFGEEGLKLRELIEGGEPCEICQEVKPRMAIDHCHNTNGVRGILCGTCNTSLGMVLDSSTALENMISYIVLHRKQEASPEDIPLPIYSGGTSKYTETCAEDHCDRLAHSRTYCSNHYHTRRTFGVRGLEARRRAELGEPCDICLIHYTRMTVDHDHQTGYVRGSLCNGCNTALGVFKEDPITINRAIEYLRKKS